MENTSKIFLKKADFSDIEFLWYLRNQPDIYRYSKKNKMVGWDEHINWVTPVILGLNSKNIFIIMKENIPIGQIKLEYFPQNIAEISISVIREFRGQGFAKISVEKAIKKIKKEKKIKTLIAIIHKKNIQSIKFFKKLNFKPKIQKDKKWLKYIFFIL